MKEAATAGRVRWVEDPWTERNPAWHVVHRAVVEVQRELLRLESGGGDDQPQRFGLARGDEHLEQTEEYVGVEASLVRLVPRVASRASVHPFTLAPHTRAH